MAQNLANPSPGVGGDIGLMNFFAQHSLPYPGRCQRQRVVELIDYLKGKRRRWNQTRAKLYIDTHHRLMQKRRQLVHVRGSSDGKPLEGQMGKIVGILAPITIPAYGEVRHLGTKTASATDRLAERVGSVFRLAVELDSGKRVIVSTDQIRDPTLY
jgi:hypothetical protein